MSPPKNNQEFYLRELEQEKNVIKELNKILINKETISDDIFDSISHELRTPVVTIKSYTEMLLNDSFGQLNQEQKEKLNRIKTNTNLLIEFIFKLLEKKKTRG